MIKITVSYFFIGLIFASCSNDLKNIEAVEISDIFIDNKLNIRALEIKNNIVYAANSDGSIYYFDINNSDVISEVKYSSSKDSVLNPNFRSLALKSDSTVLAGENVLDSIASPAIAILDFFSALHPTDKYKTLIKKIYFFISIIISIKFSNQSNNNDKKNCFLFFYCINFCLLFK